MTKMIGSHEVKDGAHWARAWRKGSGSRHEMFAKIGVTVRTFKDPNNPNLTGFIMDVPDMEQFQTFMASDEAKKAMTEDGLKVETMRILVEFTP